MHATQILTFTPLRGQVALLTRDYWVLLHMFLGTDFGW